MDELYLEDRKQEFMMKKLGDKLVVDYEQEFLHLNKYAFELVMTEERCK